jgi:Flp pilus assembly protein TadG
MLRRSLTRRPTLLEKFIEQGGRERGDSSVEMVLVFPVFAAMFFAVLQGAIWFDAGNIAQAAANAAYNEARSYDGTSGTGTTAGYDFLEGQNSLLNPTVTVTRTATEVTVTVTGESLTLIPDWFGTEVERTSTGPVERWVD